MNNFDKGHLALLKVEERAIDHGALVSKPTREESRYDAIVDWNGRLYRVQIKYGDRKASHGTGSIHIDLRKTTAGKVRRAFYTKDEIDALLVYVPQTDEVLWFGPAQFHERGCLSFRVNPTRNRQKKRVLMAADFVW